MEENDSMSRQMENDATGRDLRLPEHCAPGESDAPGMHESALNAPLARMGAAISKLQAPAQVRNRCISGLRRQAAHSWLRRGAGASSGRALLQRLRISAASAAGLLVIAALCWAAFAAPDINPFARFRPAASALPAAGSNQATSQAGDPAANGDTTQGSATYVALPYSDRSIASGTEATLEVSMPASQLMAWGVPAPGDGPDDVVPVNLVLGADGLPMAVQVLPPTESTSTNIEELYP